MRATILATLLLMTTQTALLAPGPHGSSPSAVAHWSAPIDDAAPWAIHYVFGTFLFGGTQFDVDSNGAYRLTASASRKLPKTERAGQLSSDELIALRSTVAESQPTLWSAHYADAHHCLDWVAYVTLDATIKDARSTAQTSFTSSWDCGMNGVPQGLRDLTAAIRGNVYSRIPQALTDGGPSRLSQSYTVHKALTIQTYDRTRSVMVAADGTATSRSRVSNTMYPVRDCPRRPLGAVDPTRLARMQAMLTASETVFLTVSTDTHQVFDQLMSDCPGTEGGFASPAYILPPKARWVLEYAIEPSPFLTVDNLGNAIVADANHRRRITIGAQQLVELRRLVSRADEQRWKKQYANVHAGCEGISDVRITRFLDNGTRLQGPYTFLPCDAVDVPTDLADLNRFAGAYFKQFLEYSSPRSVSTSSN